MKIHSKVNLSTENNGSNVAQKNPFKISTIKWHAISTQSIVDFDTVISWQIENLSK